MLEAYFAPLRPPVALVGLFISLLGSTAWGDEARLSIAATTLLLISPTGSPSRV